jgi:ribosomal protein S18 acetylase RimI-like enzyme
MHLVIAVDDPQADDVRALLETHLAFAHDVTPDGHVHALARDGLLDPSVTFFSARREGALLGVGALRELDPAHGELKSMHISERVRGQGVGRALVDHLLAVAASRGYERVSLETGTMDAFAPARAMYERAGFTPCAPFGDYAVNPYSVCMTIAIRERPRAVVLVEGISDQLALEALAARRGLRLADDGVAIVPIGGSKNIRAHLERFGPHGLDVGLGGLYDVGQERDFRRGLERAGVGHDLTRADMEALGFYACDRDLEDELIRALGPDAVQAVIAGEGEIDSFRAMQKQPAQRDRTVEQQLRRFIGTKSGRKFQYARAFVDALDLARVPRPLDRVLAHITNLRD